jgi:putative oxidoreductase
MNIVLWILQMMLGGMFLIHGWILLRPPAQLKPEMAYIHDLPTGLRYFIGIIEILGGLGVLVPPLINVLPILTPIAAAGLGIVMVLAAIYHIPRRENSTIVLNLVLAALAFFVAYGRFVLLPF